jgi:hypothetical protein
MCWDILCDASLALKSGPMEDAYKRFLADFPEALAAVWQLLLRLADQLPGRSGPDISLELFDSSWTGVVYLLSAARGAQLLVRQRQPTSAAAQAASRAASWALLPLFTRLATAIHTAQAGNEAAYHSEIKLRLLPIVCACIMVDLGPGVHSAGEAAQLMAAAMPPSR